MYYFVSVPVSITATIIAVSVAFTTILVGVAYRKSLMKGAPPEKSKARSPGVWTPVNFSPPDLHPCTTEVHDILPLPYKPFKWGEYHVTMGIRNMPWNEWIELDRQFPQYYRIKSRRVEEMGEDVVRVLPGKGPVMSGARAAVELVHELVRYLSVRYPKVFTIKKHNKTGSVQEITVVPLQITYILPPPLISTRDPTQTEAVSAMRISGLLVQEDLAIVIEGSDDDYYFQAGSICLAGSWRLKDKIGMNLDSIHISGSVPQYKEKLQTGFTRFFRRLPVDKPVVRNNVSFQIVGSNPLDTPDPDELAWATTTSGPESVFSDRMPEHYPEVGDITPNMIRMRTERQTLRRLPVTGAVVFTIRTYQVPVVDLANEAGVAARMASAVRSWPRLVNEYKRTPLYQNVLLEFLDAKALEIGGVVEKKNDAYPF